MWLPLDGGWPAGDAAKLGQTEGQAFGIASDDAGYAYWGYRHHQGDGAIKRTLHPETSNVQPVINPPKYYSDIIYIVADSKCLYWYDSFHGVNYAVIDNAPPWEIHNIVERIDGYPLYEDYADIAVDSTHIYWLFRALDAGTYQLMKRPLPGDCLPDTP